MPGKKRSRTANASASRPESDHERAYATWLRSKGVWWHEAAIATSRENVAAGWGVVAISNIRKGDVLFSIPRDACFGARTKKAVAGPAERDSQARLAAHFIRETAKGDASDWAPLLRMLTRAPCPWVWPTDADEYLDGTELAPVLKMKHNRLAAERAASKALRGVAADDYAEACALAVSHINPWFGGSVVPFNTTLNWSAQPNVEFDVDESNPSRVCGKATRDIPSGGELTQECAPTTAELIYRYGFAPSVAEVPALPQHGRPCGVALVDDAVSIDLDMLAEACGWGAAPRGDEAHARLSRRRQLLCAAGALDSSPWDGMDDLVTVELLWSGAGVAKLLGACLALTAGPAAWSRAEAAARAAAPEACAEEGEEGGGKVKRERGEANDDDDDEDDDDEEEEEEDEDEEDEEEDEADDAIAAALVSGLCGASAEDSRAMRELAILEGGEEGDPWPELLQQSPLKENALEGARAAALRAVQLRAAALAAPAFPTASPASEAAMEAWRAASRLRSVEKAILGAAEKAINEWRMGGCGACSIDVRCGGAPSGPAPPSAPPSPASPPPLSAGAEDGPLPARFELAAAEMPPPLRALIADNAPPASIEPSALAAAMPFLPLGEIPMGTASDVLDHPRLIDTIACASLRAAVDAQRGAVCDTVDGAADHQLNLSEDELSQHIGAAQLQALHEAARAIDLRTGGSGKRELPMTEAFVRRYTPTSRPWHPFHQDRAYVTVNVALSDDAAHSGGRLVGLFSDGAVAFERAEGGATVHLSRIVHGVTRMTSGVRYSLICFLGHEPAVRRQIVREEGPDGAIEERWSRVVVEE